jgi:hypothetical protein
MSGATGIGRAYRHEGIPRAPHEHDMRVRTLRRPVSVATAMKFPFTSSSTGRPSASVKERLCRITP